MNIINLSSFLTLLKSTLKALESQGMQPKYTSGPNKLASVTATTSKTQKAVESVLAENDKQETTQGEVPTDGNCSKTTSDIISRRNSNRRRSYTSLLMTGSKVGADCNLIMPLFLFGEY